MALFHENERNKISWNSTKAQSAPESRKGTRIKSPVIGIYGFALFSYTFNSLLDTSSAASHILHKRKYQSYTTVEELRKRTITNKRKRRKIKFRISRDVVFKRKFVDLLHFKSYPSKNLFLGTTPYYCSKRVTKENKC